MEVLRFEILGLKPRNFPERKKASLCKNPVSKHQLLITIPFQTISESNISFLFIVEHHPGMPSCGCRPPVDLDVDECKSVKFHKCLFTQITTSVGITVPNNILLEVNYKICFGNATCQKGVISVFGNPGATVQKNLPINSEHFVILEDRVRINPIHGEGGFARTPPRCYQPPL